MPKKPTPVVVAEAEAADSFTARIQVIRQVPGRYGTDEHADVYSAIARHIYVPAITGDVGYVPWRKEYELPRVERAYASAFSGTARFTRVEPSDLSRVIDAAPETVLVFRLLVGLTVSEFAEAIGTANNLGATSRVGVGTIKSAEAGKGIQPNASASIALTIHLAMTGQLFPPREGGAFRSKSDKPDTKDGWRSVRQFAEGGVPLPVFLHQRMYGGAFRQLLDATGKLRGDELEDPVQVLLESAGVPFLRTGASDQTEIAARFGINVRPAPDFVMYDVRSDTPRAMLECKYASDGGTARDKAARFGALRLEGNRLGGVPVFAVLGGRGWRRTKDALGPVVKHTDGRTFALLTLDDMLEVEPIPDLLGTLPDRSGSL